VAEHVDDPPGRSRPASTPPGPGTDRPDPLDITIELPEPIPADRADLRDPEQRTAVERSLTTVPGVLAARLVPGDDRHVAELHVLTAPDRDPDRTVRDVRTALLARFGVVTGAGVVSAVPSSPPRDGAPDRAPTIAHVTVEEHGRRVIAEVGLHDRSRLRTATAHGEATPPGRRDAVATATLESAREAATELRELELHSVELLELEGHRTVVALVTDGRDAGDADVSSSGRGDPASSALVGTALVGGSVDDAVAQAVFDAVSRAVSGWPR
jgi:hypothetical protein